MCLCSFARIALIKSGSVLSGWTAGCSAPRIIFAITPNLEKNLEKNCFSSSGYPYSSFYQRQPLSLILKSSALIFVIIEPAVTGMLLRSKQ